MTSFIFSHCVRSNATTWRLIFTTLSPQCLPHSFKNRWKHIHTLTEHDITLYWLSGLITPLLHTVYVPETQLVAFSLICVVLLLNTCKGCIMQLFVSCAASEQRSLTCKKRVVMTASKLLSITLFQSFKFTWNPHVSSKSSDHWWFSYSHREGHGFTEFLCVLWAQWDCECCLDHWYYHTKRG